MGDVYFFCFVEGKTNGFFYDGVVLVYVVCFQYVSFWFCDCCAASEVFSF